MKRSTMFDLRALLVCLLVWVPCARAVPLLPPAHPVDVVMLSDLHFDPLRDPAKVGALRAAPVMQWRKILDDPDAVTQAASFAKLQDACHARGVDSSWDLLKNSLKAARTQQPSPLFVTVSGDLLAHNFDCRLKTLAPEMTAEQISEFAAKTIAFLAAELHDSFKGSPVYLALGNNDSGCSNYHQSADSAFVKSVEESTVREFTRPADEKTVLKAFSNRGDYSVLLPHAMHGTRFIVLQDVVASPSFGGCGETSEADAARSQVQWLREQLVAARNEHQKVWVMAHIPPGVDTYASFHKLVGRPEGLCSVESPVMMLSSDELASTLTEYADIVKLALFAHTHMDEIKLLHSPQGTSVPAKLVPSISPVNGNVPAFVVAKVQPQTAVLLDYAVYTASDAKASSWTEEYRYSNAYRMPDYSGDSVAQIASRLSKDKTGTDDMSQTYQRWFFPGDDGRFAKGLKAVWPSYACAVQENGGPVYRECMCPPSGAGGAEKAAK